MRKNKTNTIFLLETTCFYSNEWKKLVKSRNGATFLTVKLSGKNKAIKNKILIRIAMERPRYLNAQFLNIILRQ